nr:MAG TPA: hypothetical protein [Caudoviricetes sp.]
MSFFINFPLLSTFFVVVLLLWKNMVCAREG